jgi:hypothetical protein
MRKTLFPFIAVAVLAGCAATHRQYSAPAPANAMDCVLGQTALLGYTPLAGGRYEGYLRVQGRAEPTIVERINIGASADSNQMTITPAAGQLHIRVEGMTRDGKATEPSAKGQADAQTILTRCAQ